ncbi:MAG: PAS domain-containing protein [Thermoanaerobaculales bacterium]|jgi:PAS domain S-box-containing protein|nr:PAS domain-containing protein [Thermoanaerobaculales bacterium]
MVFSSAEFTRGRTLAQILMVTFFAGIVVMLVLSGSLQLWAYFQAEQRAVETNQLLIAEGAGSAVAGFIQEKGRVLATAAWLTNPDTTTPDRWHLVLQELLGLEPAFRRLEMRDLDGRPVAAAARYSPRFPNRSEVAGVAERFSQSCRAATGAMISDVYIDPATSEPLVSLCTPVVNPLREPRGALIAEVNLKFMWDLVDRLRVGRTGYAFVVDQDGDVLAFGDTARVLKGESAAHLPPVSRFVTGSPEAGPRPARIYRGLTGAVVVGTCVPLETPTWAIVTELPWAEAYRGVITTAVASLAIIGVMALVAAVVGRTISRSLTESLVGLKETATRIARGERSLQAAVDGPEEVVQLSAAFNSMSSQLRQSLEALEARCTEIAAARDAVKASEERLRLAQDGVSDGIWDWDLRSDELYLSPVWYRMLGYDAGVLPPTWETWFSLLHPDDHENAANELLAATTSDRAFGVEYRMLADDGSWRWILCRGRAVTRDREGNPLRLAGSHSDVTERRKAEAQRAELEEKLTQAQRMEAVALLAGGMAHDFNNLLSVILGRAELALMRLTPEDPSYADFSEIIAVGDRSANLTRQLLAFARRQTIAPRALDLNDTVPRILKLLRRITGENVDLVWRPGDGLWLVTMDPAQVDQILANLLVNARDAIADVGSVTVETRNLTLDAAFCATHPECEPGDHVMLAVSDTGCGMDRETLSKIFTPFFTTKEIGSGTGLGLATVYGIVRQNHGSISVDSEPGRGSTFSIYIPRLAGESRATPEPDDRGAIPMGGETVLLVEDDEALLEVCTAMLEELGYTVVAANGAVQALERARVHPGPIHLAVSDVIMPKMNGRELAHRLLATFPGMKLLLISGYAADFIAHQGVLDEGLHFLQKPFSLRGLAVKLREVLDGP